MLSNPGKHFLLNNYGFKDQKDHFRQNSTGQIWLNSTVEFEFIGKIWPIFKVGTVVQIYCYLWSVLDIGVRREGQKEGQKVCFSTLYSIYLVFIWRIDCFWPPLKSRRTPVVLETQMVLNWKLIAGEYGQRSRNGPDSSGQRLPVSTFECSSDGYGRNVLRGIPRS